MKIPLATGQHGESYGSTAPIIPRHGAERHAAKAAEAFKVDDGIINPLTGEIVSRQDADGLIDVFDQIKAVNDRLYAVKLELQHALYALTTGDAKTRRVQGKRRKAKVERPDDGFDQSILKEVWNSYPDLRDQVLKIDAIGVKKREYDKLINTSGDPSIECFRDMISKANRGPSGTPRVTVEV